MVEMEKRVKIISHVYNTLYVNILKYPYVNNIFVQILYNNIYLSNIIL
jgi:hypothetical protein